MDIYFSFESLHDLCTIFLHHLFHTSLPRLEVFHLQDEFPL